MSLKLKLASSYTAPIVEWREEQGFGFVQLGATRVFLHRREFAEFHKRPGIGDRIQFSIGLDKKGRSCAKGATHFNDGGEFKSGDLVILLTLLVLPCVALSRVPVPLPFSFGYFIAASLFCYVMYAADKNSARGGGWRTSEQILHMNELIGGWPGAYIAQRRLRHKCSKTGYMVIFWGIVFAHQIAALDFILHWRLTTGAVKMLSRLFKVE
ncbi:MAG TPA: DUF1294 domain-containing protein [Verrucomicrobiae bacterium]|nr:DUF1294 domain-containing protein [Verrucomicrobiae bacterium]